MNALALSIAVGVVFMILERVMPGRELPNSRGWYVRAVLLNSAQLGIVLLGGITWSVWLRGPSLFHIDGGVPIVVQGFFCWFVGTFFLYWWHRARHSVGLLWRVFHQIHHSASRIETLTSFYKHPLSKDWNLFHGNSRTFAFEKQMTGEFPLELYFRVDRDGVLPVLPG